ncbi:hypothetical protein ACFL54_03495 [Planctomycetota bacterium]
MTKPNRLPQACYRPPDPPENAISNIRARVARLVNIWFPELKGIAIKVGWLRRDATSVLGNVSRDDSNGKEWYVIKVHRVFFDIIDGIDMAAALEHTLYHELCHIAVGFEHNHDCFFKRRMLRCYAGGKQRYFDTVTAEINRYLEQDKYKYDYICPQCGAGYPSARRISNVSCGICSPSYNPAYALVLKPKQLSLF